jgi:hypothetical protein
MYVPVCMFVYRYLCMHIYIYIIKAICEHLIALCIGLDFILTPTRLMILKDMVGSTGSILCWEQTLEETPEVD